jgi:hypothetical protein
MSKKSQPGIGFGSGSAQGSAKKKAKPRGKPFQPGNEYRFEPGASGNPGGYSKKAFIRNAIGHIADRNPEHVMAIALTMFDAAQNKVPFCNPVLAAKFIAEQIQGKPIQPIGGPDGGPIQVEYGSREDNASRIRDLAARAAERANRRRTSGVRSAASAE